MAKIVKHSRLRFADLGVMDGVEFWDTAEIPSIPSQTDDLTHVVLGNDRIDLLANRFYGDPVLWWVIAAANNLEILPTDLNEGDTLRIPSPRYVLQELFRKADQ